MVQWKRRKKGTPRQIGQPFIVDESQQKKKGLLDKIKAKYASGHKSPEHKYLERLREYINEQGSPKEKKLMEGILTESDAQYLKCRIFWF